jgi:ribonuclease HII
MVSDQWIFERLARQKGHQQISGIDEAGRGPLAGPVVSAAVVLPDSFDVVGITDSKQLSSKRRAELYDQIYLHAVTIGIGIVDPFEIDRINILQATLLSMVFAVQNLNPQPDYLLIDGIFPIAVNMEQQTIKKGDALSISIAAASIVAKVTRDQLMERYHQEYPEFGFNQHKGYPTKNHKAAIHQYGCCPIHRKSFKGVTEFSGNIRVN